MIDCIISTPNDDENKPRNTKNVPQGAVIDETVQQMTHGFVALFEKELDQVQYSLKEALYVNICEFMLPHCLRLIED